MASIQKRERKSGTTYRAQIRIKGFPPQQKTFKRLTDARHWVQQTEAAIRRGEHQTVAKVAHAVTLEEAIARYRRDVLPHKAEGTIRSETAHLSFWDKALGQFGLTFIEPKMIDTALSDLAAKRQSKTGDRPGKPSGSIRSPRTIKYYRDTLSTVFNYAKQWQWVRQNPVDELNKGPALRNERIRFLSDDERKRLLDACRDSSNKLLYSIVVFALSTGARKGEVLGVTLEDIDLKRGQAVFRNTKNGESRSVPVVGQLAALLPDQIRRTNQLYDRLELPKRGRLLFARKDGQAPIEINRAWYAALSKSGVEDFRFHDLRHSAASYLAMNGASLLEIAAVLGHKTLQMVKRYSHLSEDHTKDVVARMNNKIF